MPAKENARKIGLARALSKLGYCSRSQAGELIRSGRVRLNGNVRRDPETPSQIGRDHLQVDGHDVEPKKKIYLMLNKPRAVVTTAADEKDRKTVYALLERAGESLPWVAPVGRLDKASEGLLLLTNDSEWGARITAPETHLEKTYHVQINAQIDRLASADLIQAMLSGVRSDGEVLSARRVSVLRSGERNCWLEIVLDEGKNRQIRRMLQVFEVEVLRLVRVAIGPLPLGELAKGEFRALTKEEKRMLDRALHPKTA